MRSTKLGGGRARPQRWSPAAFVERFDGYVAAKARPGEPLDDDTVRAYCSRTRQFLAWLDGADVDGDPLVDGQARDGAVRNYRAYLLTVAKRKLSTVNAHLTAVDDFLRHVGVGPAAAKRQEVPKSAPRALSDRNRTRWLRAAQRADARGKALAYVEYYGGLRGGEVVALDVGDVRISARKGVLIVRFGKGGKYREVPLHSQLRAAIEEWVTERAGWPGAAETAGAVPQPPRRPALHPRRLRPAEGDRCGCESRFRPRRRPHPALSAPHHRYEPRARRGRRCPGRRVARAQRGDRTALQPAHRG